MSTFNVIIKGLSRFMYWIAGAALTGIMFLTVADVFLRYLKMPILGTYEIVSLLGAIVIGFAIPQTTIDRGHVLMDFLTGRLVLQRAEVFSFVYPPVGHCNLLYHRLEPLSKWEMISTDGPSFV